MSTYKCQVCKLEYEDKNLAKACYDWCSTHNSCNFQIARQAVNKNAVKNEPPSADERYKNHLE